MNAPDGSVSRDIVISILKKVLPSRGTRVVVNGNRVTLIKDGIPEVQVLPEHVPRRLLQRFNHKYFANIEYFFHPETCPDTDTNEARPH